MLECRKFFRKMTISRKLIKILTKLSNRFCILIVSYSIDMKRTDHIATRYLVRGIHT